MGREGREGGNGGMEGGDVLAIHSWRQGTKGMSWRVRGGRRCGEGKITVHSGTTPYGTELAKCKCQ